MKEFFVDITHEHEIKGEALLIKAFKRLRPGRYRCELYSTNKRSLNQNAYIHVVFTLSQKALFDAGYEEVTSPEAAKRFWKKELKHLLIVEGVNKNTGHMYELERGTSDLSKEEMGVFIDEVRQLSLEYGGVYIPTSDEYKQNYQRWDLVQLAS